jgi:hypothetical protein
VAGLVVAVAAPAEAAMAVIAGILKYVLSQAAGVVSAMLASLVRVTVSVPLAATVTAVVSVWALPLVEVA